MKYPTSATIELLEKTATGKGTCADAAAILFCMDKQVICSSNAMKENDDPTAHAAIVATRLSRREIRQAGEQCYILLSERPCPMCVSGIYQSKIYHLFFLENNKINYIDLRNDIANYRYEKIPVIK
jgi:tRNA(Arg) A34 adenosine deaminase TadA